MREVAAQFENPVLLFSGGKDSIVMTHLAMKAFYPANMPFPLLHIDTGHNFQETLSYRDELVARTGVKLIVGYVQDSIDRGTAIEEKGYNASRNVLQTVTLLEILDARKFDAALGGGRRDEEKARAKERFFSHRDEFGQWDPRNQRPELWSLLNGRRRNEEHFRVFPLSNWTELDVWNYIKEEQIAVPTLYFAHARTVFDRDGAIYAYVDGQMLRDSERATVREMTVRFRTIGDTTCTGATVSNCSTLDEIIDEVAASRITERGTRQDDKRSETAMEDRKSQGYF